MGVVRIQILAVRLEDREQDPGKDQNRAPTKTASTNKIRTERKLARG
jgi:hypothetical protein